VKYVRRSWKGDIRTLVADTTRIRGLGFTPKYPLEDGLKESISWFLAEYGAGFNGMIRGKPNTSNS
jgi:nucleoside-diphosphate-sugar epimerase